MRRMRRTKKTLECGILVYKTNNRGSNIHKWPIRNGEDLE